MADCEMKRIWMEEERRIQRRTEEDCTTDAFNFKRDSSDAGIEIEWKVNSYGLKVNVYVMATSAVAIILKSQSNDISAEFVVFNRQNNFKISNHSSFSKIIKNWILSYN